MNIWGPLYYIGETLLSTWGQQEFHCMNQPHLHKLHNKWLLYWVPPLITSCITMSSTPHFTSCITNDYCSWVSPLVCITKIIFVLGSIPHLQKLHNCTPRLYKLHNKWILYNWVSPLICISEYCTLVGIMLVYMHALQKEQDCYWLPQL